MIFMYSNRLLREQLPQAIIASFYLFYQFQNFYVYGVVITYRQFQNLLFSRHIDTISPILTTITGKLI